MKSRISMALGILAFTATTLAAQTPVTFKLTGLANMADPSATPQPIVSFGGNSYYSSPYSGAFELGTSGLYGAPFLVWCVDYSHESNFGDVYDAEASWLGGNLSDARDGNAGRNKYDWAAYLAGTMSLNWSTSANRTHDVDVQEAMWYAVSGGTFTLSSIVLSDLGLSAGFYNTPAPANSGSGWALIDGVSDTFDPKGAGEQEFLVYNPPGIPLEVLPEPATLSLFGSGLAAVMGMGFRRRRKRLS
jgi:hypothetical protein